MQCEEGCVNSRKATFIFAVVL